VWYVLYSSFVKPWLIRLGVVQGAIAISVIGVLAGGAFGVVYAIEIEQGLSIFSVTELDFDLVRYRHDVYSE
jgi:hypothetical protein